MLHTVDVFLAKDFCYVKPNIAIFIIKKTCLEVKGQLFENFALICTVHKKYAQNFVNKH